MIRRSKYGAVKTVIDGHTFDSKGEANRYLELKLLEKAGLVRDIKLQPKFPIVVNGCAVKIINKRGHGRKVNAIMDFSYFDVKLCQTVVEDFKGHDTDISRLKRALVEAIYGVKIMIVRAM